MYRGVVVVLLAAGCDLVFAIEPPPEIPTCTGEFGAKRQLPDPGVAIETVSRTSAALWLAVGDAPRALRRADFDGTQIAPLQALAFGDATADEVDLALARDGEIVLFLSNRGNGTGVYETRQTDGGFTPPVMPIGADDASPITSIDISYDGLSLYWANFFDELWTASRVDLTAPFANPVRLRAVAGEDLSADDLSISSDQLELYTSSFGDGISMRTRATPDGAFGAPVKLTSGRVPDLSPDGRSLIYIDDERLWLLERTCR